MNTLIAEEQIECVQVGRGEKFHIPSSDRVTLCGSPHSNARYKVQWRDPKICNVCMRQAKKKIVKQWLPIQARAIIRWEGMDIDDKTGLLVFADYLDETKKPDRQLLAELLRLHCEIASDETPLIQKISCGQRYEVVTKRFRDISW